MTSSVCAPYLDPGWEQLLAKAPSPRRALFLDRDGVINVDHGYVHTPELTEWVPGIFELVTRATQLGYVPIVVTNQAGIGRGYYDEAAFLAYTTWMHERFAKEGVRLLATYWCPHHPTAAHAGYRIACGCRKPAPGMLLAAARDFALHLPDCALVGDSASDLEAGRLAGIGKLHLVQGGTHRGWKLGSTIDEQVG